jgi:hypothetical protein
MKNLEFNIDKLAIVMPECERIFFLEGLALQKSIKVATGACPIQRMIRTLPGLTSLWAYGDHSCACASVLHKAVSSILSVYEYGIQDRE